MNAKIVSGGALAGLVLTGAVASSLSAQSAATVTGLTAEQVMAIALAEVPGEVKEMELETEDNMQVWEVEILAANGTEMEVEINAETGDILEIEAEDDDDDDDDDDD